MSDLFFSYYQQCLDAGGIQGLQGQNDLVTNIEEVRTPDLSVAYAPLTMAFMTWAFVERGVLKNADQLNQMRHGSTTIDNPLKVNGHAPATVNELLMAYRTAIFAEATTLKAARERMAHEWRQRDAELWRQRDARLSMREVQRRRRLVVDSDDEDEDSQ